MRRIQFKPFNPVSLRGGGSSRPAPQTGDGSSSSDSPRARSNVEGPEKFVQRLNPKYEIYSDVIDINPSSDTYGCFTGKDPRNSFLFTTSQRKLTNQEQAAINAMAALSQGGVAGETALKHLYAKMANPDHDIPKTSADTLKNYQLLDPDGKVKDFIKSAYQNIMRS